MQKPEIEVQKLEKEIVPFVRKAQGIAITNPKDMESAVEVLSNINRYADQVKASKESVTKPLNAALKAARGLFSPLEDKLDEAISSIRGAMSTYQTEQKRISDAEASKIAARVGEGKGKLKIDTAVRKIDELDTPEKNVSSESGTVKFKTVPKFEVVNIAKIPVEYLLADEVKIRKAMLAKVEIPGVRYFTEEVPVNFR